jgi:hypothetical protein
MKGLQNDSAQQRFGKSRAEEHKSNFISLLSFGASVSRRNTDIPAFAKPVDVAWYFNATIITHNHFDIVIRL